MATTETPRLPWCVLINPDWYDDHEDKGFAWAGLAVGWDDAVSQACAECNAVNDRSEEEGDDIAEPGTIDVWDARVNIEPLAKAALTIWAHTFPDRSSWPVAFRDLELGLGMDPAAIKAVEDAFLPSAAADFAAHQPTAQEA